MHSLRSQGNGNLLEKQEWHSGTIGIQLQYRTGRFSSSKVNSYWPSLILSIFVGSVSAFLDPKSRPYFDTSNSLLDDCNNSL